jgi:hypothetical protein
LDPPTVPDGHDGKSLDLDHVEGEAHAGLPGILLSRHHGGSMRRSLPGIADAG